MRFMKNSSRLEVKMARNFALSSSGVRSSSASASTRSLKSSQLRSRSIQTDCSSVGSAAFRAPWSPTDAKTVVAIEFSPDPFRFYGPPTHRSVNRRLHLSPGHPSKMVAMGIRKIVHIDMDAFYASVEQRDDPHLRGKPVVVAWRGKRSVVCAASYEARRFGVRSAMPAVHAERLCPEAIFIPPDFTRYRAVSQSTREIFKRHTDLIEPLSLDETYLYITKNKAVFPTPPGGRGAIREQIREELHLTASAGVAPNKFLAKIASDWRKPDGLFVIQPEDLDTFLPPLPIGRIPGVGKVTEKRLEQLGIKTVGDLRRLEEQILEDHFGSYGQRLYQLALGIDDNEVVPDRPTKSTSAEDRL